MPIHLDRAHLHVQASPPAVLRLTIDDLIIRFGGGEAIGRILDRASGDPGWWTRGDPRYSTQLHLGLTSREPP